MAGVQGYCVDDVVCLLCTHASCVGVAYAHILNPAVPDLLL